MSSDNRFKLHINRYQDAADVLTKNYAKPHKAGRELSMAVRVVQLIVLAAHVLLKRNGKAGRIPDVLSNI